MWVIVKGVRRGVIDGRNIFWIGIRPRILCGGMTSPSGNCRFVSIQAIKNYLAPRQHQQPSQATGKRKTTTRPELTGSGRSSRRPAWRWSPGPGIPPRQRSPPGPCRCCPMHNGVTGGKEGRGCEGGEGLAPAVNNVTSRQRTALAKRGQTHPHSHNKASDHSDAHQSPQ